VLLTSERFAERFEQQEKNREEDLKRSDDRFEKSSETATNKQAEAMDAKMRQEQEFQEQRDRKAAEKESSLTEQTRKYTSIMKNVLPQMPQDPAELMTWYTTIDNLYGAYQVPAEMRAQMLVPLLTPRAKTLIGRLTKEQLTDIEHVNTF
jgi:hypothetical protein